MLWSLPTSIPITWWTCTGLFRARWFAARGAPPVPLYAPETVLERVAMLEGLPSGAAPLRAVFDWHPLPCSELTELGRNADLYIIDATDRQQQAATPADTAQTPMLLTAAQAGGVASTACARRVLLTHFWPGNDRQRSRADARRAFSGEILLADEGLVVPLP